MNITFPAYRKAQFSVAIREFFLTVFHFRAFEPENDAFFTR